MKKISPQLLGVLLFLIVNAVIFTPRLFQATSDIIRPVEDNPNIRTSMPRTRSRFGEIMAKEYNIQEKRKIEAMALAPQKSQVLGESDTSTPSAHTPTPSPSPTPTVSLDKLDKFSLISSKSGEITLALLGDSMIDTLQKDLPQLKVLLGQAYPNYMFKLLNYGVGATNIESGLNRLTNDYDYLGNHYPALISTNPDIVVLESFAYNPWSNSAADLDRQWSTLVKIVETIKSHSDKTKIVLAATIGPNGNTFGDGVLNWTAQDKKNKVITIRSYLQNMVNFGSSTHLPMADAYHPSLEDSGEGDSRFISASDHLHPSGEGGYLFSQKVMEAIVKNKLIE